MRKGKLEAFKELLKDPRTDLNITSLQIGPVYNGVSDGTPLIIEAVIKDFTFLEALLSIPSTNRVDQIINQQDNDNYTALHMAAINGNEKAVELLLKKGAQIDSKNKLGNTALHHAVTNTHLTVVKLLVANNANREITNKENKNPITIATEQYEKDQQFRRYDKELVLKALNPAFQPANTGQK